MAMAKPDDAGESRLLSPPCFDPQLAEYPTRRVDLDAVIDPLHVSHAPERIAAYRDAMIGGALFPPISVLRFGRYYVVVDGHKRFGAYRAFPMRDVLVEVWTIRRWFRDQAVQFQRKTRQQLSIVVRSFTDPEARREGVRLFYDTIGHWRRFAQSVRRPPRPSFGPAPGDSPEVGAQSMAARDVFRRLSRECASELSTLALAALALLGISGGQLGLTWLIKLWIEGPLVGKGNSGTALLSAAMLLTVIIVLSVFASRYLLNRVNQRVVQRLRDAAQGRLLAMTFPAYRQFQSGDVIARFIADGEILSGFLRDVLRRLVGEGLVLTGAVAMMFYLDWRLALATCCTVPPVAVLIDRAGRVLRRRSARVQNEMGAFAATLKEQLDGWTTIKVFETEGFERSRFQRRSAAYQEAVMAGEWWSGFLAAMLWLVTGLGLLAVVTYGSGLVQRGQITAGTLVAFGLYLIQTVEPLRRLGDVQALLQRALAAGARLLAVIDCPSVEAETQPSDRPPQRGEVRLQNLCFAYRPDQTVLDGIDLNIATAERIAVVGGSGSGKSTLAALLTRLVDPTAGRIVLDGSDLQALSRHEVRRVVCLVESEPFIFSGTLLDNVRYGAPEADASAIDGAILLTGLTDLVRSLPHGYDSVLEERGRNLSMGQKQRIVLARAIIRAPALLVLDEATSGLDGESEAQIFAALDSWLRGRTLLVISHRLATVARFPRIVMLDRGRVAADGSFGHLTRTSPPFAQLFADQLLERDRLDSAEEEASSVHSGADNRACAKPLGAQTREV